MASFAFIEGDHQDRRLLCFGSHFDTQLKHRDCVSASSLIGSDSYRNAWSIRKRGNNTNNNFSYYSTEFSASAMVLQSTSSFLC